MKKLPLLIYALLAVASTFANSPSNIDDKLLRLFSNSYPRAEHIRWEEMTNKYMVSFVENGIQARIIYQKDGSIESITRYYAEENLPAGIRQAVKREYKGQTVWGVIEVSADAGTEEHLKTVYFIKLVDNRNWTTIKMDSDGNTEVTERYRKAL